jgi:hypothetical protein
MVKLFARAIAAIALFVVVALVVALAVGGSFLARPPAAQPTTPATGSPDAAGSPEPTPSMVPTAGGGQTQAPPTPVLTPSVPPASADLLSFLASHTWVMQGDAGWIAGDFAGDGWPVDNIDHDAVVQISPGGLLAWQVDEGGVTFTLLDADNGTVVDAFHVEIDSTALVSATVDRAAANLFFQSSSPNAGSLIDDGVSRLDLATGEISVAVEGAVQTDLTRAWFKWSPSGNTLVSGLCDEETCPSYDVLDTTTANHRRVDGTYSVHAVNDQYFLARDGRDPSEQGFVVVDWTSGTIERVADELIAYPAGGAALPDGRFLADGFDAARTTYVIAVIDPATGASALLYEAAWEPGVTPELRPDSPVNARWAVLIPGPLSRVLEEAASVSLPILDLQTGDLASETAQVSRP